jgi:hypothetical protein
VLCVIVVPLPPGINPLAVTNYFPMPGAKISETLCSVSVPGNTVNVLLVQAGFFDSEAVPKDTMSTSAAAVWCVV